MITQMTYKLGLLRWHEALLAINKSKTRYCYCERLYKMLNCSKTYIRVLVKSLAKNKLIKISPEKKINRIIVTEKGQRVINALSEIKHEVDDLFVRFKM